MKFRLPTIVALAVVFLLPLIVMHVQSFSSIAIAQAPVASFAYTPEIPAPDEVITFDASASYDSDGWIVSFVWDFGDGNVSSVAVPTIAHSYPVDGSYTVELAVTDNSGMTGVAVAVVEVSTEVYFRACFYGTAIPMSDVEVTMYYYNGYAWVKAPVGYNKLELRYDNMTQPDLANTYGEKYRNPGFTASILRYNASNIGFDIHPSYWEVFFTFKWGSTVTYWPNDTTRVYSYNNGAIEAHDYCSYHDARWDSKAGTYVIKATNIPSDGVSPCENHPIIVGVWCPPPPAKYYLSVRTDPSAVTTIPGEGWYYENTNATLTAPSYVTMMADTRYRFSYWDVDGSSKGSGVNPITVLMNANHTATAHYVMQYSIALRQNGLLSDAAGTVVTVDGSAKALGDLPFTKWVDSGGSVTYSYNSLVTSSITGKRYRTGSVTGPSSPITVSGPVNVTGNYVTQYQVTFAQTGLDFTATGTVVTVNGSAKTYGNLPHSFWADCSDAVTYSYSSIVSSSQDGKRFALVAVHCPPPPFTVTGTITVTGEYRCQYRVTFGQTGLDSTAIGTVVTVNGSAKTYGSLPYIIWANSGSTITYSYSSTVSSTITDKHFRLNTVTGPSSPIAVTGSTTVTGGYVTQYLVTFAQTGLDSTATGTVVTVNGGSKTYGDLPYSVWVDSGGSVTYSYGSTVPSSVSGKRFRLSSVTGPASPISVAGPTTVTGNYVIQYSITFSQTGLDATATGTVVIVNGSAKTYEDLPYSVWVDCGSTIVYTYTEIIGGSSGTRFRLGNVTGPPSPITVVSLETVTGNYVKQYTLTFTHSGLDSTATGTVVTVNADTKTYAELPYTMWVDAGASVTYSYNDVVLSAAVGKQFKLTSVTGPSSPISATSPMTVTGNYKIQHQVTFDQTGVGADFTGTVVAVDSVNYGISALPVSFWWDQNTNHNFAFASPLVVNASVQYSWSSTTGLSTLQSGTLAITASGTVTGNYLVGNCITFDVTGVGSDFLGTVVIVDGTSYGIGQLPVSFVWQTGSLHNFSFQSPLLVTADLKRYIWNSTTGLSSSQSGSLTVTTYGSIIGNYKTQYYLTLSTSPPDITTPTGSGWYYAGTYAFIFTGQYVPGGSRYRFAGWTTDDMSEITDPMSVNTTVLIDKGKTVTATYIHQYFVIFSQTGLASDASGTVVTVDFASKNYGDLPFGDWYDEGTFAVYSYESVVLSSVSGKRFSLTSVTGPSSPIQVFADTNVIGNYGVQYYLTVTSPYGTIGGQGWYNSGSTAYATLNTSVVDHENGTRHVFTNWNGNASGTNHAQSSPITMNAPKTALAMWKTQHTVGFVHSGLDSSAVGTVVNVNGSSKAYDDLPYSPWTDAGSVLTYTYGNVSSSTAGKRFILTSVSGLPSPITVNSPTTVIGNYKTQYQITFAQSGVGSDFTGTAVTIDGTGYMVATLPQVFWWDSGSTHPFAFLSPLVVNVSRQYLWASTTGLSSLQNDTLTIADSGSVTGNYNVQVKHLVTFVQSGVGSDFVGAVVAIDGTDYTVPELPYSFWWNEGSVHTFAYYSPLDATPNLKRYVWNSTTGLSSSQNGSITVTISGNVTGNYETQYYLTLATDPLGVDSPSGAGWYYASTYATISTDAFVDIAPGASRYRFNGWTTDDMPEIADPAWSPTTVLMDKGKTVTANYVTQYNITFAQSGVGPDFTGTVAEIDGVDYTVGTLPHSFWWDKDQSHAFAFQSPLEVAISTKQYVWTGTSGLSTLQIGSITVTAPGSVTGSYKTQYYLTVTSARDNPTPTSNYFDAGTSIPASVTSPWPGPVGTRYICTGWTGTGSTPASGTTTSTTFTITQPSSITWNWKTQYYLTVKTDPSGIATISGEGWYNETMSATLVAPPVPSYQFVYWDVDGASQGNGTNPIAVAMNAPHTATAHYTATQLVVTISPSLTMMTLGESVNFTPTVNGGTLPYTYEWYVNGTYVGSGTTLLYTPPFLGTYYVYLNVTDFIGTTAQSNVAKIIVNAPSPIGGYTVALNPQTTLRTAAYLALVALFGVAMALRKRKRK